jgi:hypothetical protein
MRIGWASPFNERSAMSRYSLMVCEELRRRGTTVEVLRTELGPEEKLPALDSPLTVYPPAGFSVEFLAAHFDLCVVNVADSLSDRRRAIEIARAFQSVSVFHGLGADSQGAGAAFPGRLPVETAEIGWAAIPASLSTGAVVHDERYLDAVRRLCAGPVAAISLDLGGARAGPPAMAGGAGPDAEAARPPEREGCVEKYVDALLEVLDEALRRAPLRNAGWTIGATVAEMGLAWDDPLSSRLGNEMFALFEGNRRG